MTVSAFHRGHKIYCEDEEFVYEDGVPVRLDPQRACGYCGKEATPEGHDGCLGTLPDVRNACCGHGRVDEAYIQHNSLRRVSGEDAIKAFKVLGCGPDKIWENWNR